MKEKLIIGLLMAATFAASAGKVDQASTSLLSRAANNAAPVGINSTPDSSVTIDFSVLTGESWDAQGSPNNVIGSCVLGGTITGIEWTNVEVATVGLSWLSEATMLFSDSAGGGGISLSVGNGDDFAGTSTYSSGGIIDFTDNALPDIVALGDGLLPIEFFEGFDDAANAIDANFTAGTVTIWGIGLTPDPACQFAAAAVVLAPPTPVPSLNLYALVALFLALLVFGYKRSRA